VAVTYLDFELPLAALDTRIEALRRTRERSAADSRELRRLETERRKLERTLYDTLSAWQRVELARHIDRPQTLDYVERLCADFFELHGDRAFGDDAAIVGGIGTYRRQPIMVVGHQRGHSTQERLRRNFGSANPEGYRKALRLFHMAERLGMPILTFIDTQGAYTGVGAEQRGQAEAIAHTLRAMALLRVPIVSVVIGEGGSGGALALGLGDRLLMQEYSCYSVISPEGCSAILYRDRAPENVARAAEALRLTARDLYRFGVIDEVVSEPVGGAHRNPRRAGEALERAINRHLAELKAQSLASLLARRYEKFRRIGRYVE
jgi:acetyl-CoA carboxylase carboxyl transferase subunit alpha